MTGTSKRCSLRSSRAGLTLIEVSAGLLILSTLLVASVLGFQRHARQIRRADHVLKAVAAADRLLEKWMNDPASFPPSGSGDVAEEESLEWHAAVVSLHAEPPVPFSIARLEIYEKSPPEESMPLATVEVIIPAAKDKLPSGNR